VGSVNLTLLAFFALLEDLVAGFDAGLHAEYVLLAVLLGLVAVHGTYFGRRLKELAQRSAASEEEGPALTKRRRVAEGLASGFVGEPFGQPDGCGARRRLLKWRSPES
jgi:hypothetical protein